jgi:hypothetical protein
MGHQMLNRFLLHDLANKVKPFCSPSATETVDREPATVARYGPCLVVVKAVSGEALAPRAAQVGWFQGDVVAGFR